MNRPEDYEPKAWQATLLLYAVILAALFLNTILARVLPQVEVLVLLLHIAGFFAVLIPLVSMAPKASPEQVFKVFTNAGGWPTDGLSFFVGIVTTMFAFIGVQFHE